MGQFFLGENHSSVYPHMRDKFGRGPTAVSKKVSFNFISRCSLVTEYVDDIIYTGIVGCQIFCTCRV